MIKETVIDLNEKRSEKIEIESYDVKKEKLSTFLKREDIKPLHEAWMKKHGKKYPPIDYDNDKKEWVWISRRIRRLR